MTPRTAAAGDNLYAAADVWGVDILDIEDPADIARASRKLSRTQIPRGSASVDEAIDVAVAGETLYVLWRRDFIGRDPLRWEYTVQRIDVSEPDDPRVISETADIPGDAALKSLTAAGNSAFFLNSDRIHVISTSE